MNTAAEVLGVSYPDFHWALEIARNWLRSGDKSKRREARKLLEQLRIDYPHAPQIGQWLVLALIDDGDTPTARQVLMEVEKTLENPDEETLCRWGRICREQGDNHIQQMAIDPSGRKLAIEDYLLALTKYREAYSVRFGHYPHINIAELLLILASLDDDRRAEYRRESRKEAQKLLDRRASWPKTLPDDDIWHLATEAHAYLLLGNWALAVEKYREAARQATFDRGHEKSIRGGAQRTVDAYRRMDETELGGFDWQNIFPTVQASPVHPDSGQPA